MPKSSAAAIALANPEVLWEFVTHDVAGRVFLVEESGRVVFANHEAMNKWSALPGGIIGASLYDDIASGELGQEWRRLCDATLADDTPSAVETMIRGVRIRAILRPMHYEGRRYLLILSRDVADIMAATWELPDGVKERRGRVADWGPLEVLTDREREILGLIGLGLSAAQIAKRLGRSPKTIEWHRHQIGQKLHVKTRVELATMALRAGLTPLEDARVFPAAIVGEDGAIDANDAQPAERDSFEGSGDAGR